MILQKIIKIHCFLNTLCIRFKFAAILNNQSSNFRDFTVFNKYKGAHLNRISYQDGKLSFSEKLKKNVIKDSNYELCYPPNFCLLAHLRAKRSRCAFVISGWLS